MTYVASAADPSIAVNVSPRQIRRPGFADLLASVLSETGLPPSRLELEITESTLMADHGPGSAALEALADAGVRLAVDDFGTGFSNLACLQRFPIGCLKIDRSFIERIGHEPDNDTLVSAVLAMARNMRLRVIAEGVETVEQIEFLKRQGCAEAQGFYYARPMSADAFFSVYLSTPPTQ